MLQSMTAFARSETNSDDYEIVTEMRSYNSKNLDLVIRLPHVCQPLEERIKTTVAGRLHRGRVEVRLDIREVGEDVLTFEIDLPRARAYYNVLEQLRDQFQLGGEINLEMMVAAGGVVKPAENEKDLERLWGQIEGSLVEALDQLIAMRRREGQSLREDFLQRLQTIEDRMAAVQSASRGLLPQYQQRLKARIAALTSGVVDLDPARIAQEAALLADRSDIAEEIVRAQSHLQQFRHIMENETPAGRKLNFLIQEFNREFNTMGSKTGKAEVSHLVVELKAELEKIREQVQNIE
ncbi:MAG: YicC family protein [Desulfosarcina sp.]|nr:YicC family protein [Desulfobacterales bacterium]